MEEEQPRTLSGRRAGCELPAAPGLRFDKPRPVPAGFIGGAVPRAAVGDHDLDRSSALGQPRDPGRRIGKGRAENTGGVEGRDHDAEDGRHGADDGC